MSVFFVIKMTVVITMMMIQDYMMMMMMMMIQEEVCRGEDCHHQLPRLLHETAQVGRHDKHDNDCYYYDKLYDDLHHAKHDNYDEEST